MFEPTSRYYALSDSSLTMPDGREIKYKHRRFLPQGKDMQLAAEVGVVEGDRLDQLAARTMGDPEQFWRICDANDTMNPLDLMEIGRILRICVPQF